MSAATVPNVRSGVTDTFGCLDVAGVNRRLRRMSRRLHTVRNGMRPCTRQAARHAQSSWVGAPPPCRSSGRAAQVGRPDARLRRTRRRALLSREIARFARAAPRRRSGIRPTSAIAAAREPPRAVAHRRALHGSSCTSESSQQAACSTPAERPPSPRRPLCSHARGRRRRRVHRRWEKPRCSRRGAAVLRARSFIARRRAAECGQETQAVVGGAELRPSDSDRRDAHGKRLTIRDAFRPGVPSCRSQRRRSIRAFIPFRRGT